MEHQEQHGQAPTPTLDQLLRQCQRQEQAALADYGKALQALERANQQLEDARQDYDEARSRLQQRSLDSAAPLEMRELKDLCLFLRQQRCFRETATRIARRQARLAFSHLLKARYATTALNRQQLRTLDTGSPHLRSVDSLLLPSLQPHRFFWN